MEKYNICFSLDSNYVEQFLVSATSILKNAKVDENICLYILDGGLTKIHKENLDMIGFSFSFDMDFYSIFGTLERYGFALKSADRKEDDPLIFVGGPVVTANPEPYKEFFDFFHGEFPF